MRCPHGKVNRKLFAWRHSDGAICPAMVEKSYEKTTGQWKPEEARFDKPVDLENPEVMAHLVTQEGVAEYAEWLCGGKGEDILLHGRSILHKEMFKRIAELAHHSAAFSLLDSTLCGIRNFYENVQFVKSRCMLPVVDSWYARLVKPSVMAAKFGMPRLNEWISMEEVQAVTEELSAKRQSMDGKLRASVEEVARGLR